MRDFTNCTYVIGKYNNESKLINMLGTGFLIDNNHIVTTLHVVNGNDFNLRFLLPHISNINDFQDVDNNKCAAFPLKIIAADPIKDLCILEIEGIKMEVNNKWEIGCLEETSVGEKIGIWGYPHCVEGRRVLTYQETELGAKMIMSSGGIKCKYGTINIQTRPGQSGSPVYNLLTNRVIGILVGAYAPASTVMIGNLNPFELNQTSFCISAEYLLNMM